jgi:hypothetical protein
MSLQPLAASIDGGRFTVFKVSLLAVGLCLGAAAHGVYLGNPLEPRGFTDGSTGVLVEAQFAPTPSAGVIVDYQAWTELSAGSFDLVLLTPISGNLYLVAHRQTVDYTSSGLQTWTVNWATPANAILGYFGAGPSYDYGGGSGTLNRWHYSGGGGSWFPPEGQTFDITTYVFNQDRHYSFGGNFEPVPEPASLLALFGLAGMLIRRRTAASRRK